MKLLPDAIVPKVVTPSPVLWWVLGVVAAVLAVSAALVAVLVVLKKKKGKANK